MAQSIVVFWLAAAAEIAGCFGVWSVMRLGRPVWWLGPSILLLMLFAYLLTLVHTENAGRAYAIYGGIYIVASLGWLWAIEGVRPDRYDVLGSAVCLAGAAIILFAPRN